MSDCIEFKTLNPHRVIRVKLEPPLKGQRAPRISARIWHFKRRLGATVPTLKGFTLDVAATRAVAKAMLEMADCAEVLSDSPDDAPPT